MWSRREIKKQGRRQFLRNWWTTVAVCFILAFTGAEFADSVGFVRELDLSAIPGSEPAVVESVHLSNWDILLKWLEVDPADGTHPLWAAADQSVKPVFETLTQPFSAFFAFLDLSQFTGWTGVSLAVIGVLGGLWFAIWVVGVLAVGGGPPHRPGGGVRQPGDPLRPLAPHLRHRRGGGAHPAEEVLQERPADLCGLHGGLLRHRVLE